MRSTTAALLALPVLILAACGDDSATPATQPPDATVTLPSVPPTASPTTSPPSSGYEHAMGADDVVLRIAYEGGFVPVGVAFANVPALLVTGDGRLVQEGPQIEIYPGPLLPNLQQRSISEQGIQALLALAEEHGLLADVTYAPNDTVADAPDTVVTITVAGTTYEHRAYALGFQGGGGSESDPARAALADFVAMASDVVAAVGAGELGLEEPYETDSFLIQSVPLQEAPTPPDDIEPTIVEWPADASVRLADAAECAEVPFAELADVLGAANQLTYFTDAGPTYQVSAIPRPPGRHCA